MKILVPTDGSECAARALETAITFARSLNAEIVVCHVVDVAQAAVMSGGEAPLVEGSLAILETDGAHILDAAVARAASEVRASSLTAEGRPVEEIERLAGELQPAFIVIGSHGRTGLERAVMGSVAEGVVRSAPVPVMVVPRRVSVPC